MEKTGDLAFVRAWLLETYPAQCIPGDEDASSGNYPLRPEPPATATEAEKRDWAAAKKLFDDARQMLTRDVAHQAHLAYMRQRHGAEATSFPEWRQVLLTEPACAYFCRAAFWTPDEIAALLSGIDPRKVDLVDRRRLRSIRSELDDVLQLVERAQWGNQLVHSAPPAKVLDWAGEARLHIPAILKFSALEFGIYARSGRNPTADEGKALSARERTSLLKLVIGMAVKKYRYNPEAARTSTATNIANDLIELGIPLDTDTIRNYLVEGKDLLPGKTE